MGDAVTWLVDLDASLDEAPALAEQAKDWFLAKGVVSPTLCAQPAYDGSALLERGPAAQAWDTFSFTDPPAMCGLAIGIGRTVFHTGDNGIDAIGCPACSVAHDPDDLPWSDAVGAWFLDGGDAGMACPSCDARNSIVDWHFDRPWGFGNLAYGFWNWPVDERVADALSAATGRRYRLVYEHI